MLIGFSTIKNYKELGMLLINFVLIMGKNSYASILKPYFYGIFLLYLDNNFIALRYRRFCFVKGIALILIGKNK